MVVEVEGGCHQVEEEGLACQVEDPCQEEVAAFHEDHEAQEGLGEGASWVSLEASLGVGEAFLVGLGEEACPEEVGPGASWLAVEAALVEGAYLEVQVVLVGREVLVDQAGQQWVVEQEEPSWPLDQS